MDNKRFIGFLDRPAPTADEYEAQMAPLREGLRKEATKTEVKLYSDLTIRQMASFLLSATGGRSPETFDLEYLGCVYDIDSPEDFRKWTGMMSHSVDLEYARISLYPERVCPDKETGTQTLWVLRMMGHPGDPISMARYTLALQRAGVHFHLPNAGEVLRQFNKEVGYRKRSLRRLERMKEKQ